jgi:BirA family biotin operon repressor/biotin-[acetyl-CoA-carboxylase] ligase
VVVDDAEVLKGALLGLIGAVAACDAIRSAAAVPTDIRWPNDLVVHGRKVGGVLVESRPRNEGGRVFVAGIGINCLQQTAHFGSELRGRATSLEIESPGPVDRAGVARSLVQALDAWLADAGPDLCETVRAAWLARADGLGQAIRLRHGGQEYSGVVLDLDPTSALVVQLDQGGRMLFEADGTTVLES